MNGTWTGYNALKCKLLEALKMLLSDEGIRGLIDRGILVDATADNVQPITYDLRTRDFVQSVGNRVNAVELMPGDSTYVECVEGVELPPDLAARVMLKNSRIREGLTLDAPLYFPGHKTRLYFRVTNVSGKAIRLNDSRGIAQVAFEEVASPVSKPYDGAFQNEVEFSGLGDYKDVFEDEVSSIESKVDEVKGIERRMYANVLAIMAILAGVFTLVNVNVTAAGGGAVRMITMNLATVGSFAALVSLIAAVVGGDRKRVLVPVGVAAVCFAVAIVLASCVA